MIIVSNHVICIQLIYDYMVMKGDFYFLFLNYVLLKGQSAECEHNKEVQWSLSVAFLHLTTRWCKRPTLSQHSSRKQSRLYEFSLNKHLLQDIGEKKLSRALQKLPKTKYGEVIESLSGR